MGCTASSSLTVVEGGSRSISASTGVRSNGKGPKTPASPPSTGKVLVMGKYEMHCAPSDVMGEGTSSICRRGTDTTTGQGVAIKVYKDQQGGGGVQHVTLQKFKRQIAVLKELMQPFTKPAAPSLWADELAQVQSSRVFMQLLDYSKDAAGEPAPDPIDGMLYVVTELAQYSLKDLLSSRREQGRNLAPSEIRNISKAVIVAMAGLHAKGYVHIDMKPENLMMFSGRLKVIDVDGCVRAGTQVSILDPSISFSPCYCAPEWARFLIKDTQPTIVASPALDVWSVGMTLCELVSLDAVLKPKYANFLRNASSHREAGFLFMEWLSSMNKAPVPKTLEKNLPEFASMLSDFLLVPSVESRKSCAQCLSHSYLRSSKDRTSRENGKAEAKMLEQDDTIRRQRDRPPDESMDRPLHIGTLWKLNRNADPADPNNWIKRDMWIASNHSLCYFSVKENKRLVLIDGQKLTIADYTDMTNVGKEFAFSVSIRGDTDDETIGLACDSAGELKEWMSKLKKAGRLDMIVTMQLGKQFADDIKNFKLAIKNRRIKVESEDQEQCKPLFKEKLWKLKNEGDRSKREDWFYREMWIAKNGSLVYWSPKEERELIYYTSDDVARSSVTAIPDGECCFDNAFRVALPPAGDVEFTPGEFAADSPELRDRWIQGLRRFCR